MALINKLNYATSLKQSTQGRAGIPDANIFMDTPNNLIELIGDDELATFDHTSLGGGAADANQLIPFDGVDLRAIYNFENIERVNDESLRGFLRGSEGKYRLAGAYNLKNGVKFAANGREYIRGSGFIEFAENGLIDRIYHGVFSLNPIQPTTAPEYALVSDTLEATLQAATWTVLNRLGDINEVVQVFGSTANGDTGAGDFDDTLSILIIRARSYGYVPGETTSTASNISELSGFSGGYGVGETLNPANTFPLADVFGGSAVAPFTGMSLTQLGVPQLETGFNEVDGNFTWVLANALAGSAQQCAAYLDAAILQNTDIDSGAGTYIGTRGRVFYTRNAQGLIVTSSIEGRGLFIEGLSTAEKQNVIMTDDAGNTKTSPFFPDVQINVGADAPTDPNAFWHMYYVNGAALADFDTVGAVPVNDSSGSPMKGNVATDAISNVISRPYAYDTDTDAGLVAGTDKNVVVIVAGHEGVDEAITFFTITRTAIIPVTCAPKLDDNA